MPQGTIKGKAQLKVLQPDETYSTRPFVCVEVKTKNRTTHTDGTGRYGISDEAGPHKLIFLVKPPDGLEVEIYSEDLTIVANEAMTRNLTFDLEKSEENFRGLLTRFLKIRDKILPGSVSGKVRSSIDHSITIADAKIWIAGVVQTYSDEDGRYGFCALPGTYTLCASHPPDYQEWSGPLVITELDSLTKNINMKPV